MRAPIRWVTNAAALSMFALALLMSGCDRSDAEPERNQRAGALEQVVEKQGSLTIKKQVRRLPDGGTVNHGLCVMTYADGTKAGEGRYEDGQTAGIWRGWYANGQLSMEGKYVFGKKDGRWTWWNKDGSISKQASYARGLRIDATTGAASTQPTPSQPAP